VLEFETLVYLGVQKTGSRFIKRFLRRFVAFPEVANSNGMPRAQRKEGALHVISVRHPMSQYLSLYSYGCEGRGWLRERMNSLGHADMYSGDIDGFARWLELVVAPEAAFSGDKGFGFHSTRFLLMALPGYPQHLRGAELHDAIKTIFSARAITDVVLKQETLNGDLSRLVGEHSGLFRDHEGAIAYLAADDRINVSPKRGIDPENLPMEIRSAVRSREWLLFDLLGYQQDLRGQRRIGARRIFGAGAPGKMDLGPIAGAPPRS